ncbi:unnamed protein product [Orchesella dallaii]|uniref:DUF4789 domain-containing protein n=1 Tax=Orchesella dallaii TaxID=48710 RepID=A0ABP1QDT0_9HEXA
MILQAKPRRLAHFVTICVLLCLANCASSDGGQRVLWLFMLPQSQFYHGRNPKVIGPKYVTEDWNSVSNYGRIREFNEFHDHSQSLYSPPVISPLFVTEYGSDSWQKDRGKDEPVYYDYENTMMGNVKGDYSSGSASASGSSEVGVENLSSLLDDKPAPTTSEDYQMVSSNRCMLEGHQARFDPVTGGCYTIGTKGPCGEFMMFTASLNDNFNGICDCDYDSFDMPMVYIRGKCHFLYTQSLCFPGYWLTTSTLYSEPICQLNPCHAYAKGKSSTSNKNPFVLFKDECIRLNSPSRHCRREGEVVLFPKGSNEPACGFPKSTRRIYRRQISNINRFRCGPGMRRHHITKKCIKSRAIVFG